MKRLAFSSESGFSYPTRTKKTILFLWVFLLVQYLAASLSFIIPDNNGPFCSGNDPFKLWQVVTSCNPGGVLIEKHSVGGSNAFPSATWWWLLVSSLVIWKAPFCCLIYRGAPQRIPFEGVEWEVPIFPLSPLPEFLSTIIWRVIQLELKLLPGSAWRLARHLCALLTAVRLLFTGAQGD